MVAVDTNFLIRLLIDDAPEYTRQAQALMDKARPRSLLLDRITVAETVYVLKSNYRMERALICQMINGFLEDKRFRLDDEAAMLEMHRIYRTTNVAPEDAWLAALVLHGRATDVHTFDKELKKYLRRMQAD